MELISIVAMDVQRAIGNNGKIPWYVPEDFKFFKETTMGCPLIMGRKTFESIGKPLPGRKTVVVTRQDIDIEGVTVVNSIADAIKEVSDEEKVFVCGGGEIYEQTMDIVDTIYCTTIFSIGEGESDVYFPPVYDDKWDITPVGGGVSEPEDVIYTIMRLDRKKQTSQVN